MRVKRGDSSVELPDDFDHAIECRLVYSKEMSFNISLVSPQVIEQIRDHFPGALGSPVMACVVTGRKLMEIYPASDGDYQIWVFYYATPKVA